MGVLLRGVIFVDSISASQTKVSAIENSVLMKFRLSTRVPPMARLRITHPPAFTKVQAAISTSAMVQTGDSIPRKAEKRHVGNMIEIVALEEMIPRATVLEVTVSLGNPSISPPLDENIWRFETAHRVNAEREW